MNNKRNLRKLGFTLVELIIVIAIVAILSVISFLRITKWISQARDSSRKSDISTLIKSTEIYLTQNSSLPMPSNYTGIVDLRGGTAWYQGEFDESVGSVLNNLSKDDILDPKGNKYGYSISTDKKHYQFKAELENTVSYYNNLAYADFGTVSIKGNYNGYIVAKTGHAYNLWNSPSLFIGSGTVINGYNNILEDGKNKDNYVYTNVLAVNELFVGGNAINAVSKIAREFALTEEQTIGIIPNIAGGEGKLDIKNISSPYHNIQIADGYSCGIKSFDNLVYCWGYNKYGQLGNGMTGDYFLSPVIPGDGNFYNIAVGQNFTCGIKKKDGLAYCWGYNTDGQLGNGTTDDSSVPIKIGDGNFTDISLGWRHACGKNKDDGSYYCWGRNNVGQLGGSIGNSTTPVKLFNGEYTDLKLGARHTCGKNKNDGLYYCWGGNQWGQLGNNSTTDSLEPVKAGNDNFISLSAGREHTCGIKKSDGLAYCWGSGTLGSLGDGNSTTSPLPVKAGSGDFIDIKVNSSSSCGIKISDGFVYCWGDNASGQLGNGTTTNSSVPIKVGNGNFVNYTFNYKTIFGIKENDNKLYGWGKNNLGQIGNGFIGDVKSPILKK